MPDERGFWATAASQPIFWKIAGTVIILGTFVAIVLAGRTDVFDVFVEAFVKVGDVLAKAIGR